MALILIKEDGTGKSDANTYANVADADAYHRGHLYASAWTAATDDNKTAVLAMATRLIDVEYQFGGTKAVSGQALQWPRLDCREPDGATTTFKADNYPTVQPEGFGGGGGQIKIIKFELTVPSDMVPKVVVEATCEMARELLIADRTAAPLGEGLKYQNVGTTQTGYDKSDRRPIISQVAQAMLVKYGTLINGRSGAVRLVRT